MLKAGQPTLLIWPPLSLAEKPDMDMLFRTRKCFLTLGVTVCSGKRREAIRNPLGQVVVVPVTEWAVLATDTAGEGHCWKG